MINIAFAGFRHSHIYGLYQLARESERVNIAGAWEDFEQAKETARVEHNVQFTHNAYNDLLNDNSIDAIAIGNYYGARGEMAISALNAGKHVIADKPLCTSTAQLGEIERLSREKNLKVGLMLDMRYSKNVLAAKKVISEGKLGKINNICFGGQHPLLYGIRPSWYFEQGKHCGVINDIAIHGIDLIRFMTGLEVKNISAARCWNAFAENEPDFKDSAQMMLELDNSAGVIADVSYSVPNSIGFALPYYWKFEIWGTRAMMVFSANSDGVTLYSDGSSEAETVAGVETKRNVLLDFLDEIDGKSDMLLNTNEVIRSSSATLKIQVKANNEQI